MIILFHNNTSVTNIFDYEKNKEVTIYQGSIQQNLFFIAEKNPFQMIGWAHSNLKDELNLSEWKSLMKHPLMIHSFETQNSFFISKDIGFIEDSPFIKVPKKVQYPTWQMSSDVGLTYGGTLLKFEKLNKLKVNFGLFLNIISKLGMKSGIHCYSSPKLLKLKSDKKPILKDKIKTWEFIWFVKNHYKLQWVFFYMFMLVWYKKKFPLLAFLKGLLKSKIQPVVQLNLINNRIFNEIKIFNYDVLIPTLGREKYLKDVLQDLANQTIIPKKVILIEQQPVENAPSTLDFIGDSWPFEIDHSLIYQLGACNARNVGIKKISSDWTFFADDDIRFEPYFMESAFSYIEKYKTEAVTLSCLQQGEEEKIKQAIQWSGFGSGCSIVKSDFVKETIFNKVFEFGYGEDYDYGMQLRNKGIDVLYFPFESILHLKAPMGGFRKKIRKEWENEVIQPKPSPTIMVSKILHATKEQIKAYKLVLFIKFYKNQSFRNPIKYNYFMQHAWNRSQFWANELIKRNS